jgi:hypothetical protein
MGRSLRTLTRRVRPQFKSHPLERNRQANREAHTTKSGIFFFVGPVLLIFAMVFEWIMGNFFPMSTPPFSSLY